MKKEKKESIKLWIKRVFAIGAALFMIALTITGAMAYSIDSDDEFYSTKDNTIDGNFIIVDYVEGIALKSNMEWVSLEKDKYVSEKTATGTRVIDENYLIPYYITVPDNADIGVYRGTIEVLSGSETQYLNVKISVQNGVITSISKAYQNPKTRIPIFITIGIIMLMLLIITFRRAKNGKR